MFTQPRKGEENEKSSGGELCDSLFRWGFRQNVETQLK